jgi:site-specific DNA-methyltransferase (adenine-specific)
LKTRSGDATYSFSDIWDSTEEYVHFLSIRLQECHRCLKHSGSVFFHCDRNSSHITRPILDRVFGAENFQSEIIWSYRRWSNSRKGLIPSHQTIFFYSRSEQFKFEPIMTPYSESTNIDQILQKRGRDNRGKAIYARDDDGVPITNGAKRGVPLGDVWDIPFLNPKARERVGYPTQKPILLMERIIKLCTHPGDLVVDPFCGSGSTLVAAEILGRSWIGIDKSREALSLVKKRLRSPIRSGSQLLQVGRVNYARPDLAALKCLEGLDFHPVHRSQGIDAILTQDFLGKPVCIRIQRCTETTAEAAAALLKAASRKGGAKLILVASDSRFGLFPRQPLPDNITVVYSVAAAIRDILADEPVSREVQLDSEALSLAAN